MNPSYLFSDAGELDANRDRVIASGPVVAVVTGHTNHNAAGCGPFELGHLIVERELRAASAGPLETLEACLRAALERCHAAIAARSDVEPCHTISGSAIFAWFDRGRLHTLDCGGCAMLGVSDQGAELCLPRRSLKRAAAARGIPLEGTAAEAPWIDVLPSLLGVDELDLRGASRTRRNGNVFGASWLIEHKKSR